MDYWGEGYPWLSIADMNQGRALRHTKEQITSLAVKNVMGTPVPVGTVLLSFKLSIGKVGISEIPLYTNEAIAALPIRDANRLDAQFLYWALCTIDLMRGTDRAVMGQTLNKKKLASIAIPIPPLDEQRRIAQILDKVDALRAKRREAIALLDELVQIIFSSTFGNPLDNSHRYATKSLLEWVDPLRPITYGILKPGEDQADGVKYVRVVDMKNGGVDFSTVRMTTTEISNQYRRSLLKSNDLLMSIRGHVGRLAQIPPSLDGANITQDSARIAVAEDSSRYVMECLRSPAVQYWMARRTKGAAVKGINLGDIKILSLPEPPIKLQKKFAAEAAGVDQLKDYERVYLAELDALFASLQYRAFRGELRDAPGA
jgi:type I restriction enzyme S subunit